MVYGRIAMETVDGMQWSMSQLGVIGNRDISHSILRLGWVLSSHHSYTCTGLS